MTSEDRGRWWKGSYGSVCKRLSTSELGWHADVLGLLDVDQFLVPTGLHDNSSSSSRSSGDRPYDGAIRALQSLLSRVIGHTAEACALSLPTAVVPTRYPSFSFSPPSVANRHQWWVGTQFARPAVTKESPIHSLYHTDPALLVSITRGGSEEEGEWLRAVGLTPTSPHAEKGNSSTSCAVELSLHHDQWTAYRFLVSRSFLTEPLPQHLGNQAKDKGREEGSPSNPYSDFFFSAVHRALSDRNLDLLVELPPTMKVLDHSDHVQAKKAGYHWVDYDQVWASRHV